MSCIQKVDLSTQAVSLQVESLKRDAEAARNSLRASLDQLVEQTVDGMRARTEAMVYAAQEDLTNQSSRQITQVSRQQHLLEC